MDCIDLLLQEAQAVGLTVEASGEKLVIRGPRSAEPLVRRLIAHKPALLAALSHDAHHNTETKTPVNPERSKGFGFGFAGWVHRQDAAGRWGWEAPDLEDWRRWWARCDFDDLPVVPEGFRMGEIPQPAPQDRACCVSAGMADTLDLGADRLRQGHLRGCGGV